MTNKLTYNGSNYDRQITAQGGGVEMNHAMVGETLTVDSLTVPVIVGDWPKKFIFADQEPSDLFVTADRKVFCGADIDTLEFIAGESGLYYHENALVGKYFAKEFRQTSQYGHMMLFYSAMWVLDKTDHMGGIYSGQSAEDVAAEIVGGTVDYTIDDDLSEIQVYGYLPKARRRSNLQMLLMAIGGAIRNAADGTLRITPLTDTVSGTFNTNRVFIGGSVIYQTPATAVRVTEHNFIETAEEVTIYENTTVETETITFNEPYHDLTITNGTISASGPNYCTFTGTGAVTIKGKRYLHITRVITHGTVAEDGSDNIKTVTNNTLLTPNNATEVAEKLYNYLTVAQSIKAEVVFGTERPGDVVKIVHPYTKQLVDACIKSLSIQMGLTELRAVGEFLINYIPPGPTAGFEHYAVLTGSSSWSVPAGVTRIRAIIVGGGGGGAGGSNGSNTTPAVYSYGAAGGTPGEPGRGAFIFEINLTVTPESSISFSCGAGGNGGTANTDGSAGGSTTFGAYSSASGRLYPYGYSEPKSGLTIAADGDTGVAGGQGRGSALVSGSGGTSVIFDGVTYGPGTVGLTITHPNYPYKDNYYAYGGGGGGPAVGANGGNGGDGTFDGGGYLNHGSGGNGANAAARSATSHYGQGGSGGHGGGGGGGRASDFQDYPYERAGTGGKGGAGGTGGKGGDGIIIVYY